ncbi:hypothetical protein K439DRAFT_1343770, partial [Ramaria rubella]
LLKQTSSIIQSNSSLFIQVCTGHIPLNHHLQWIGKADSSKCPHCLMKEETIHHFLMICLAYAPLRHKLEKKIGCGAKSIQNLLGNPKAFMPLILFIWSTTGLKKTFRE